MEIFPYVVTLVVCLVLSAFFSGSETALLRLRGQEIEREVERASGPTALAVRDLVSSTSRLLVTILLGNNVANILGASVASAIAVTYLGAEVGIPVATVAMTVVVLVLCEVFPKAVAAAHPMGVSRIVGLPLYLLHQILRPVHVFFDRILSPAVRRLAGGAEQAPHTAEDLLRLARQVGDGHGEGTPLAIIGAASKAAEMTVGEIMVPRTEIVAFSADTDPARLLEEMIEERYTRAPIYEGSIDRVLGIAHLKDVIKLVRGHDGNDVRSIVKPVLRVAERKPILPLLGDMQRAFCHVAMVKDEFGVTQGMVTQEDILEEIVGEIRDEFDREELETIQRLEDGSWQALGRTKVLDFNRETGWDVPSEPGDTMGGLVLNTLGRAPRRSESARAGRYEIEAIDVSGSRIARVRVSKLPEGGGGPGGRAAGGRVRETARAGGGTRL